MKNTVLVFRSCGALAGRPIPHFGRSARGDCQQNVLASAQLSGECTRTTSQCVGRRLADTCTIAVYCTVRPGVSWGKQPIQTKRNTVYSRFCPPPLLYLSQCTPSPVLTVYKSCRLQRVVKRFGGRTGTTSRSRATTAPCRLTPNRRDKGGGWCWTC